MTPVSLEIYPRSNHPVTSPLTQLFTQGRPRVWKTAAIHTEVQGLCWGGQRRLKAQVSCAES